ncbi:hypothetical protein Bca52824_027645 [Brassica carinata]|uniref:Uncharacterized protein n=1 Tax=Brassica carinata TaxID=52824 RepID=A0A8X8ANG3_BRACI|nr:hypothetical protein Bca52824_027645 [Brassica carinata]
MDTWPIQNTGFRQGFRVVRESLTRFGGRRTTTLFLGSASSPAKTTRTDGLNYHQPWVIGVQEELEP